MSDKIINDGRTTSDAGFEVRQNQGNKDVNLEQRHRYAAGPSQTPLPSDRYGEAQARELEENQTVVNARKKIDQILAEEEAAERAQQRRPQQRRPQQPAAGGPGLSLNDLMDGIEGQIDAATDDVARDLLIENFHSGQPSEAALYANSYASQEPTPNASQDWTIRKYQATLRGGKKVPVWKVYNEKSKMSMETPFRIMEAAERIATILNQSGDVNDRRIRGVMEAYNQHRKLMKHIRQLREAIKAGNTKLRPRLSEARDQLEQVNIKLGI